MKRKRGRPKRETVDSIRGMDWYHRVAKRENKTAYALEKQFSKDQFKIIDGAVVRPCLWDKYAKGLKLPSKNLVARVEEYYPGTEYALNQEFWSLFREELPSNEILKIIVSNIRPILVKHIGISSSSPSRYPLDQYASINSLGNMNLLHYVNGVSTPLHQFMGLLAIMIDGKKKGNKIQCDLCMRQLLNSIEYVAFHYFSPFDKEFLSLFKERFLSGTGIRLPKEGVSAYVVINQYLKELQEKNNRDQEDN